MRRGFISAVGILAYHALLISMKHDAIVEQGIPIYERIPIPDELIPEDSRVEIDASKYPYRSLTENSCHTRHDISCRGCGPPKPVTSFAVPSWQNILEHS